jgi:hypothetical protein
VISTENRTAELALIASKLRMVGAPLNELASNDFETLVSHGIDLGPLAKHLNNLADLLHRGDCHAAAQAHNAFTVVPHAVWMGRLSIRSSEP